jgi:hypothetical protein
MADYRPFYCSFWTDPDMERLNPLEKLVYAMLMTCAQTTESGIYAISEKYISERTNITVMKINEILNTLQNTYNKITYDNGTIFIHAFMKRNFKGNPEMLMRSILKSFDNNPSKICWTKFLEIYKNHCIFNKIKTKLDTLQSVGDTSLNMNMTLSIIKGKEDTQQEGISKCEGVQGGIDKRSELFKSDLKEFIKKYPGEMLKDFFDYWTEPNPSKTKMRFELQKTWELSRRLATWAGRQNIKARPPINQNHSRVLDDSS